MSVLKLQVINARTISYSYSFCMSEATTSIAKLFSYFMQLFSFNQTQPDLRVQ